MSVLVPLGQAGLTLVREKLKPSFSLQGVMRGFNHPQRRTALRQGLVST